jgi:hypothetical protein
LHLGIFEQPDKNYFFSSLVSLLKSAASSFLRRDPLDLEERMWGHNGGATFEERFEFLEGFVRIRPDENFIG